MKYRILIILSLIVRQGFGQCVGTNCYVTINQLESCIGDSSLIEVKTNGVFIGWKNDEGNTSGIGSPYSSITKVNAISSFVYTAQTKFMSANLVSNGDFENGKNGFSSDYNYKDTVFKTGDYSVGKNPKLTTNSRYVSQKDHTSGKGNMLIVDGSSDSTKAFYRVSTSTEVGKVYVFDAWVANAHSEFKKTQPDTIANKPPVFQLIIDGKLVAMYRIPLDTIWHKFSYSWVAQSNKTISIELKDKVTTNKANDFTVDDIYLGTVNLVETKIAVKACKTNHNTLPILSPDGDGNLDTYFIAEPGNAKIIDLSGNVIGEFNSPILWDGTTKNGTLADAGYYAIVVNNDKVYRVSLIR